MDIEIIILSEVSQTEKDKYHISSVHFSSVAQLCPTLCDPMDCMYAHNLPQDLYWGYNGK